MKVMIISDEIQNYLNFIKPLASKHEVYYTGYIETARYKLKNEKYDLIIVEINMRTLGLFSLEETYGGAITGIIWYKKELEKLRIPVLFWSFVEDDKKTVDKLRKEFPNNKFDLSVRDTFKEDYLLEEIEKFLMI